MDVDALISAVFHHSAILDKRKKEHANRVVLDNAWKDISRQMNVEGKFEFSISSTVRLYNTCYNGFPRYRIKMKSFISSLFIISSNTLI